MIYPAVRGLVKWTTLALLSLSLAVAMAVVFRGTLV